MRWFYPFLVGTLFGVIQTGYFFQLDFALASTYGTFLLITLSWLAGSVVGLRISRFSFFTLQRGPWICLVPYVLTQALLSAAPFQSGLWPLYAALVLVSGTFSGVFFARLGEVIRPVRRLFFAENNGFIVGIVACTIAYLVLGRPVLWILPVALTAVCWVWSPSRGRAVVTQNVETLPASVENAEVHPATLDR
jgi:hypothetical protein